MQTLPAYAKVSEYQLGIEHPDDTPRNVMNLKLPAAPKSREAWAGQIAFAAMSQDNARALMAWAAQFDGRKEAWLLPMPADLQTAASGGSATLHSNAASGAAFIALDLTVSLPAGTLLTLGASADDAYQVVEVLEDVNVVAGPSIFTDGTRFTDGTGFYTSATNISVEIAPRIRWPFLAGATVVVGETNLRVRLASDDVADHSFEFSHGVASLNLVEAVNA